MASYRIRYTAINHGHGRELRVSVEEPERLVPALTEPQATRTPRS